MMIDGFAIMLVGIFVFLILLEQLCREVRSNWKRRVILRRYAHTEQVLKCCSNEAKEPLRAVSHQADKASGGR